MIAWNTFFGVLNCGRFELRGGGTGLAYRRNILGKEDLLQFIITPHSLISARSEISSYLTHPFPISWHLSKGVPKADTTSFRHSKLQYLHSFYATALPKFCTSLSLDLTDRRPILNGTPHPNPLARPCIDLHDLYIPFVVPLMPTSEYSTFISIPLNANLENQLQSRCPLPRSLLIRVILGN